MEAIPPHDTIWKPYRQIARELEESLRAEASDPLLARVLDTAQPTVVLTNARFFERLPAAWQDKAFIFGRAFREKGAKFESDVQDLDRHPQSLKDTATDRSHRIGHVGMGWNRQPGM